MFLSTSGILLTAAILLLLLRACLPAVWVRNTALLLELLLELLPLFVLAAR